MGVATLFIAPSFQSYEPVGESYIKNNKDYISLRNPTTGRIREARVYSEKEWLRLYGSKIEVSKSNQKSKFSEESLKKARGFSDGPIHLVNGLRNTEEDEEWVNHSVARYATDVGWYIVSTDSIPADAPPHVNFIPLTWEEWKRNKDCAS